MDANRFMSMGLGEVCGRLAGAVQACDGLTGDAKLRISMALNQAGSALTGDLGSLLRHQAVVVSEYVAPPADAPTVGVPAAAEQRPLTSELGPGPFGDELPPTSPNTNRKR